MSRVNALNLLTRELGAEIIVPAVDFARGHQKRLERISSTTPNTGADD